MKLKLLALLVVHLASLEIHAQIHLRADDLITLSGYGLDSAGIQQMPDSLRLIVLRHGVEEFDAWYDPSDIQCSALNGGLTFVDVFGDIDNDAGPGLYEVKAGFFLRDDSLYDWRTLWIYQGVDLAAIEDTVMGIKDILDARETWSLTGRSPIGDTIHRNASVLTEDSHVGVDWSKVTNQTSAVSLSATVISRLGVLDEDFTSIDLDSTTVGRLTERAGYRLSPDGVGDIWSHGSRSLSALGFALDSADFADSCFDETHFTAGYFDSAQGAAGGLDSADLANAVWNAPALNHDSPGTFGDYLDTKVSGLGTGGGAYAIILTAVDTLSGQTVPGVRVAIRNPEQTSLIAVGRTDASGTSRFNLDLGEFLVVADAPGYLFAPYDSLSVNGPVAEEIKGRRFDPGLPASPSLCRVYGFVYGVTGLPERGAVVSAGLPKGVSRTSDLIVSPSAVTVSTDSSGYFFLDLIPSSMLEGESRYELTITRTDGAILRKRFAVPSQASWLMDW